ncbi:Anthranilate phosphoribosyltransferase [Erysiphe neolycopersici]|uniref:Anthranilate phosphoribosyltransferase n=1 Tax=Erysiphe neolycopersici TaxID=212602 RepID=A0A420HWL1_9PEZI|nr:Anthranilate phosphoribosyltransferase [Erysiphe neolycopersici]
MLDNEESNVAASPQIISITALLQRMWPSPSDGNVTAAEIAQALSYLFDNQLSPVQAGALLTCLHFTKWELRADVLAACALSMRDASLKVDHESLSTVVSGKHKIRDTNNQYRGGLCDIVGTGGDSHNTFNISTASSILASALLQIAKHGNRASTSKSGSADVIQSMLPTAPNLKNVTPKNICKIYENTNYAFISAPNFHPGMRFVAPVRKELGWRTIFNLLGPLTNPVEQLLEARVLGVARKEIGPLYAEVLKIQGVQKALVVCGEENLDEISCAGKTYCWKLSSSSSHRHEDLSNSSSKINEDALGIESFLLEPADFGLPSHPLVNVSPGKEPKENANILLKLLQNQLAPDDPILHFVLMNTSALFVISGVCEADASKMGKDDDGIVITERGPGGGRWKEGVRRARWAIESGEAWRQWNYFVEVSNSFNS